jgi:hypothetical protein
MSMKNSNDNIWNRTRDFPTCSAVPQPNAPPRALRARTETPKGNTFFHVKHNCISDGSFLLAYDVSFGKLDK